MPLPFQPAALNRQPDDAAPAGGGVMPKPQQHPATEVEGHCKLSAPRFVAASLGSSEAPAA
ncbi:hypothetical protein, partial [Piscinibacter sp.]|uniref:hypothetical protein n=1 Tax=Piscinibacter sp. TaxID=1903157 RepID=UPI002CD99FDF